jgi:ABC-type glutathione transport system ATPase component
LTGLEHTREVLDQKQEDEFLGRTERLARTSRKVAIENVNFAYEIDKPVLHDVSFESEPGMVTALVGPSGAVKSATIGSIASFYSQTKVERRFRIRSTDPGSFGPLNARENDVCNRPSPIDRAVCPSDFDDRGRPNHRTRHARIALCRGRPALRSLLQAAQ